MKRKTDNKSLSVGAEIYSQHNTPPPIEILDGSLSIETAEQLTASTGGPPFRYSGTFGGQANIAHLKVAHGCGDLRDVKLNAKGSKLTIELENTSGAHVDTITIEGGGVFVITSSQKLTPQLNVNPNGRRKHKYVHSGTSQFRVSRIQVEKQGDVSTHPAGDHHDGYFSEEFRILIWLEK